MGRSRSRRGRGKSGGQGSGGSGKGKGKGGSRGRSSGTRGGQGKGGSGKGKGTGGSRGRSNNTRGGQSKANRNQNKKARSNRTINSVKKAVGNVFKGAAAHASAVTKPKSKLQQQLSNLRKDIAQKSTKEARYNRRADRLKRQFGLDTRDMRNLKINVNVDQAAKRFGLDTNRFTKGLYGALPKSIRNFRFNTELGGRFRSPHRLGVREGYRRPNRGQGIRRPIQRPMPIDTRLLPPEFGRPVRGVPRGRTPNMGPEPDWLGNFYNQYNIGGKGGNLDQAARDYWSNEAKTKGIDAVKRTIFNTAKAEGTLGGAFGNPEWGMIKDTWTGPRGRKHYSFENTNKKIVQKTGLRKPSFSSRPTGTWRGMTPGLKPWRTTYPSRAERERRRQNRAAQKSYDLQAKGMKRRQGMLAKTIAATMAARGI